MRVKSSGARRRGALKLLTLPIAMLTSLALVASAGAFSLDSVAKSKVIGSKSNGKTVPLTQGARLTVSLEEGSDGGYHWIVTSMPKASVLKIVSNKSISPSLSPGEVGGMSTRKLVLKALHPGKATLKMLQLGPGETKAKHSSDDETFTVTVDVR